MDYIHFNNIVSLQGKWIISQSSVLGKVGLKIFIKKIKLHLCIINLKNIYENRKFTNLLFFSSPTPPFL